MSSCGEHRAGKARLVARAFPAAPYRDGPRAATFREPPPPVAPLVRSIATSTVSLQSPRKILDEILRHSPSVRIKGMVRTYADD
ncbi:hypothetical protein BN12_1010011 [Nostocoides japonicum T1-X7]|uniref:Uncharacterized protein n=1 Tax=Nostocoides japonicum T1-X7 TaxID=1194083 RepID=A0A077LVL1_9MICO|nr:hypothetical protein BN12_1010011 [Tetrasphaera japonica T1-X7]